jgi:hypothetical protein
MYIGLLSLADIIAIILKDLVDEIKNKQDHYTDSNHTGLENAIRFFSVMTSHR